MTEWSGRDDGRVYGSTAGRRGILNGRFVQPLMSLTSKGAAAVGLDLSTVPTAKPSVPPSTNGFTVSSFGLPSSSYSAGQACVALQTP